MASGLFCETFEAALKNDLNLDLDNDTFKCLLTTASFSPNYETMATMNDVSNELPASGNYSTGGETLTSVTFASSSDGTGTLKFDAADVSWANSTLSNVARAVVYDDTLYASTGTNKCLVACIDFGGAFSTTSGTFQIQWNAAGIFTLDLKP
jgi:hypothetical protein|tara:strand:+ start:418 stop:873 length:456 start_codon:yes stop_codon:yes gene_type:complete